MLDLNDEKYMLTIDNINNLIAKDEYRTFNQLDKKDKKDKQDKKEKYEKVDKEDLLFWTIYKLVNSDYNSHSSSMFKTEKDFKIKCIEDLRKIKEKLKIYKLRLNEIENQLLNEKKINLSGFFALALLFSLNIFYVYNNKFYEFICNPDSKIYVINNNNNVITFEENNIDYYRNNYFYIENINKPIKSITSYAKDDLLKIAEKLNIDITNKSNKKDIYEKIINKIDL